MAYVLDSNILVAALRSRQGASFRIPTALLEGRLEAVASTALLLEYADVLQRDKNLAAFWVSPDEVQTVLAGLATYLRPVAINFRWRPQLSDPGDELVLECAINGMARAIVTFNQRDFLPAAPRFGIEVYGPAEVILLEQL